MIGDVLASTVICEVLKQKYPQAQIDYLIYPNTAAVVEGNPFIDHLVIFESEYKTSKKAFWKFLKRIRKQKYNLVVDAYGKTESNLISLCSRAPKRVSYRKWYTRFCYTHTIDRKGAVLTAAGNAIENRLRLVASEYTIKNYPIRPKIFLSENEKNDAKKRILSYQIDLQKPLIMIGILGSSQNKSLPPEIMAKIIDRISEKTQGSILLNYIPSQINEVREIYDLTAQESKKHICFDLYGKSLREFLVITSHCNMLIGNEGGAVNMAKALNTPTFTIFSPWINKDAWNMFENGSDQVSVHLSDFEPVLYKDISAKVYKDKANELYKKLSPERILPLLDIYLDNNIAQN